MPFSADHFSLRSEPHGRLTYTGPSFAGPCKDLILFEIKTKDLSRPWGTVYTTENPHSHIFRGDILEIATFTKRTSDIFKLNEYMFKKIHEEDKEDEEE